MPRNKEVRPTETANIPDLVDICRDEDGKPVFLIHEGWVLTTHHSIERDGITYIPPPQMAMPWLLPRAEKVIHYYGNDRDDLLFIDIVQAIRDNCELPSENLYPLLASWVLHTHLIDKSNYSPIIIFYAVAARGKTRTCRLLLWMSRRGIHVESLREPDIIRKSERFQCPFLFDIMDVWQKAERMGAEDILLGRFDKGIIVPRVTKPEVNGFGDTQHFSCFGPTLIASNEPAHRILDTRGILITMRQAVRRFDNDPREPDFLPLRERATAFRARWMQKALPLVDKPARDRLGDIVQPLFQISQAVAPESLDALTAYLRVIEGEKADALADTPEGTLVEALLAIEGDVFSGKVETKKIAERLNEGKPDRYHTSPFSVGKRMAALGFKATRIGGQQRGYIYDEELLNRLAVQYGHAPSESVASGVAAEDADDTSFGGRQHSFQIATNTSDPATSDISENQLSSSRGNSVPPSIVETTDAPDPSDAQDASCSKWDAESCRKYADTFRDPPDFCTAQPAGVDETEEK